MKMKFISKCTLIILYLLSNLNVYAQSPTSVTVYIRQAGTLSTLIPDSEKYRITDLTIVGYLNRDDMRYLKDMAGNNGNVVDAGTGEAEKYTTAGKLAVLNLADAKIYYDDISFFHCQSLISITLPNDLSIIKDNAFFSCYNLKEITANRVTTIGWTSFYGCTSLTNPHIIPNNVFIIKTAAFGCCTGLTSIVIPDNVRTIESGGHAFYGCTGLKEFIVSSQNYNFTTSDGILLSKDKTTLVAYPTGKSNYYIPEGIINIGKSAFSGCVNLRSITIPKTVKTIEYNAFLGCERLKEIRINNPTPPKCSSDVFSGVDKSTCFLYVPKGSYNTYWFDNTWGNFMIVESDFATSNEYIMNKPITVYSNNGIVSIDSNEERLVTIYNISGQLVKRFKMQGERKISLREGIYIIKAGDFVTKLRVE